MKTFKFCFIALLLCASLLLISCSYKPIEPTPDDLTVVGQINGRDVYLDELRFAVSICREQMILSYGDGIFEGDDAAYYIDMLRETVISSITEDYAVLMLCEEAYINLGEQQITAKVDEKLNELVDELGSMSAYRDYLEENNLTDRYLRLSTEISLMKNELFYVYTDDISVIENDDERLYDIFSDEFICVRHIFVPYSDADVIGIVKEELISGNTLDALIDEYNYDSQMTADGRFILKGFMSKEYEDVAFKLNVGEISDIVEDSSGFYFIERMESSAVKIMMNFDYLKQLYQAYEFSKIIAETQSTIEFIPNEIGLEYINSPERQ